jgi:putative ABC transport system permease protein
VTLELHNVSTMPANEVIVRSTLPDGLTYLAHSATLDGAPVGDGSGNPFATGPALAGHNLGSVAAGASHTMTYDATAAGHLDLAAAPIQSSFSTRESLTPTPANRPDPIPLAGLVTAIRAEPKVAFAEPLSFADLAPGALASGAKVAPGPVRVFGFDSSYTQRDTTIKIVTGTQGEGEALVSAEAAKSLRIGVGDTVSVTLPDGSRVAEKVSGTVDVTRARVLFGSRRGSDFESFVYVPNAVIVGSRSFADAVVPAFERVAPARGEPLKNPPVNEVEVGVRRNLLNAAPDVALGQTRAIAAAVTRVADHQDYLIDNISNTLSVARADAAVAKRMFLFLGVPGGLLAAILAAYAGNVLAGAQRREQATLRIRGASRRHLLSMLSLRVSAITAAGAIIGVSLGFATAAAVIGRATLLRATTPSLVVSGVLGTVGGLLATGAALYITGRRSIDREINEDRARLAVKAPVWRRLRLDIAGVAAVAVGTAVAVGRSAFDGIPGSVYEGRSVQLPLALLVLPIGAWMAGSLLAARGFGGLIRGRRRQRATTFDRTLRTLYRLSTSRRSWAVAEGAVVVGLIVALGTSLSLFTASYDAAKAADARYVVGSDVRISPSPASEHLFRSADARTFAVPGIDAVTPVVYSVHNVVLHSRRTEELSSLAAVDPDGFGAVAPLDRASFPGSSPSAALALIRDDPSAVLLSANMADFLQAKIGDPVGALLVRGTAAQVETSLRLAGTFERLPGFPDGADALMNISRHESAVPSTATNFYLARTVDRTDAGLARVADRLRARPGAGDAVQVDTRATALAKDQSSLAALNIRGLLRLDSGYALAMVVVAIGIFVFGLLLQRRREYVTLRAQGLSPRSIRGLITAEAATMAIGGTACGLVVGTVMGLFLVRVLRPLFVLAPPFHLAAGPTAAIIISVLAATILTSTAATSLVGRLRATELLRDE